MAKNRRARIAVAAVVVLGLLGLGLLAIRLQQALLLLAGSTPGLPRPPARAAPARPPPFEQACQLEGRPVCSAVASGAVPRSLIRPLRFPRITGGHCPASPARDVSTPDFDSLMYGRGLVRVGVDNPIVHGTVFPGYGGIPGWLGLKTHFVSVPAYQGLFLVRARRLDRTGPIRLGAAPARAGPYLALSGRAYRETGEWREIPDPTFVKGPGCYAWQVDGLTFSEIIVARIGPRSRFSSDD